MSMHLESNTGANIPFSGHISSIPLIIQDNISKSIVKESKLYYHSRNINKVKFGNVINFSLIGVCQEGTFSVTVDDENCQGFRKPANEYTKKDWISVLLSIFSIDAIDLHDNKELYLSARYLSSASNYDLQTKELIDGAIGEMDDMVIIDIKVKGQLPITIGSIQLKIANEEVSRGSEFMDEQNLFNWMDLLISKNLNMQAINKSNKEKEDKLKEENLLLKEEIELTKKDYQLIIRDFESKFYQLLNSKKDKIWSMSSRSDHLEGLNELYVPSNLHFKGRRRESDGNRDFKRQDIGSKDKVTVKTENNTTTHEEKLKLSRPDWGNFTDSAILKSVLHSEEDLSDESSNEEDPNLYSKTTFYSNNERSVNDPLILKQKCKSNSPQPAEEEEKEHKSGSYEIIADSLESINNSKCEAVDEVNSPDVQTNIKPIYSRAVEHQIAEPESVLQAEVDTDYDTDED